MGRWVGGGGEGRRGTGEGTARSQYPTSDLTTLDPNSASPCRNPGFPRGERLSGLFGTRPFWGGWGRGLGRGGGGAWWVGSATPRSVSHVHTHTRSLNPSPSLQRTHHRDQSSYISHFYSPSPWFQRLCSFFFVVFFHNRKQPCCCSARLDLLLQTCFRVQLCPGTIPQVNPPRGRSVTPLTPPSSLRLLFFFSPLFH